MAYYATARIFADPFGSFLKGFRQAQADRRSELALLDKFRRTQLLASGDRRAWEKLFLDEEYRRDTLELDKDRFEFDREKFEFKKSNADAGTGADVDPAALAAQIYNQTQRRSDAAAPQPPTVPAASEPYVSPPEPEPVLRFDTDLPENAQAPTGAKKYTDSLLQTAPAMDVTSQPATKPERVTPPTAAIPAMDVTRQPTTKPERVTPPAAPTPAGPAQLPPAPAGPTLSDKARARQQSDPLRQDLKRALDEYLKQNPAPPQDPQQRLQQVFTNNPLRQAVERANRKPAPPVPPPAFVPVPEGGGKPIQDRIPVQKPIQDRIPPANVERAIALISTISQRLSDPNLSPQARQQLQQALQKAQEIVRRFNQGG